MLEIEPQEIHSRNSRRSTETGQVNADGTNKNGSCGGAAKMRNREAGASPQWTRLDGKS